MTLFFSSSITDAQAATFSGATDSILFNQGESATGVRFQNNSLLGIYDLSFGGHTFHFSAGLLGARDFTFSDNSHLFIGTSGAEQLYGTVGNDALFGGDGGDLLSGGGAGADVMNGGGGQDVLFATGAFSTFVFDPGQSSVPAPDQIDGWQDTDLLEFSGLLGKSGLYEEATAASYADATAFANKEIASGAADYVVVQIAAGRVYLFVDSRNDNGVADDAVSIDAPFLTMISAANIKGATAIDTPPPPPSGGGHGGIASISGNMDAAHVGDLMGADIDFASPTQLNLSGFGLNLVLRGSNFTYDSNEQLTGGTVTRLTFGENTPSGLVTLDMQNVSFPAAPLGGWVAANATDVAFGTVFAGDDDITGSGGADLIRGYGGNDQIGGLGGADTLFGGAGNDTIGANNSLNVAGTASTYLRGEDGADSIVGASGFDDINGNQGNDTAHGNAGDDWVVGGKDNDALFGDDGGDIVWGNLGNDTLDGGSGADQVRGGQGDDVVNGGAGNDFVSGDRGNDTITGGTGADNFHDSQDAGIDRVLDFNLAEGDKVMLDPGTTFTVSQVGADTVIDMGGGNQMILVGVQMSTLPPGTIFLS